MFDFSLCRVTSTGTAVLRQPNTHVISSQHTCTEYNITAWFVMSVTHLSLATRHASTGLWSSSALIEGGRIIVLGHSLTAALSIASGKSFAAAVASSKDDERVATAIRDALRKPSLIEDASGKVEFDDIDDELIEEEREEEGEGAETAESGAATHLTAAGLLDANLCIREGATPYLRRGAPPFVFHVKMADSPTTGVEGDEAENELEEGTSPLFTALHLHELSLAAVSEVEDPEQTNDEISVIADSTLQLPSPSRPGVSRHPVAEKGVESVGGEVELTEELNTTTTIADADPPSGGVLATYPRLRATAGATLLCLRVTSSDENEQYFDEVNLGVDNEVDCNWCGWAEVAPLLSLPQVLGGIRGEHDEEIEVTAEGDTLNDDDVLSSSPSGPISEPSPWGGIISAQDPLDVSASRSALAYAVVRTVSSPFRGGNFLLSKQYVCLLKSVGKVVPPTYRESCIDKTKVSIQSARSVFDPKEAIKNQLIVAAAFVWLRLRLKARWGEDEDEVMTTPAVVIETVPAPTAEAAVLDLATELVPTSMAAAPIAAPPIPAPIPAPTQELSAIKLITLFGPAPWLGALIARLGTDAIFAKRLGVSLTHFLAWRAQCAARSLLSCGGLPALPLPLFMQISSRAHEFLRDLRNGDVDQPNNGYPLLPWYIPTHSLVKPRTDDPNGENLLLCRKRRLLRLALQSRAKKYQDALIWEDRKAAEADDDSGGGADSANDLKGEGVLRPLRAPRVPRVPKPEVLLRDRQEAPVPSAYLDCQPSLKALGSSDCTVCGCGCDADVGLTLPHILYTPVRCAGCRVIVHTCCLGLRPGVAKGAGAGAGAGEWMCETCDRNLHSSGRRACEICSTTREGLAELVTAAGGYVHAICALTAPLVTFTYGGRAYLEHPDTSLLQLARARNTGLGVVQNSLRCCVCSLPADIVSARIRPTHTNGATHIAHASCALAVGLAGASEFSFGGAEIIAARLSKEKNAVVVQQHPSGSDATKSHSSWLPDCDLPLPPPILAAIVADIGYDGIKPYSPERFASANAIFEKLSPVLTAWMRLGGTSMVKCVMSRASVITPPTDVIASVAMFPCERAAAAKKQTASGSGRALLAAAVSEELNKLDIEHVHARYYGRTQPKALWFSMSALCQEENGSKEGEKERATGRAPLSAVPHESKTLDLPPALPLEVLVATDTTGQAPRRRGRPPKVVRIVTEDIAEDITMDNDDDTAVTTAATLASFSCDTCEGLSFITREALEAHCLTSNHARAAKRLAALAMIPFSLPTAITATAVPAPEEEDTPPSVSTALTHAPRRRGRPPKVRIVAEDVTMDDEDTAITTSLPSFSCDLCEGLSFLSSEALEAHYLTSNHARSAKRLAAPAPSLPTTTTIAVPSEMDTPSLATTLPVLEPAPAIPITKKSHKKKKTAPQVTASSPEIPVAAAAASSQPMEEEDEHFPDAATEAGDLDATGMDENEEVATATSLSFSCDPCAGLAFVSRGALEAHCLTRDHIRAVKAKAAPLVVPLPPPQTPPSPTGDESLRVKRSRRGGGGGGGDGYFALA